MTPIRKTFALAAAALLPLAAAGMEPRHHGSGNIAYISGGVGEVQQQAMREAAPKYSLGLTFSTQDGAYLANVKVDIKDQAGKMVFSAVSDGPMLLVDLPGGSYLVEAGFQGKQQQQKVKVADDGHRQVVMRW